MLKDWSEIVWTTHGSVITNFFLIENVHAPVRLDYVLVFMVSQPIVIRTCVISFEHTYA